MAPNPKCSALANAMSKRGLSYSQIASATGSTEQRVIAVVTGQALPTDAEFNSLAQALGFSSQVPHTGVHTTA